MMPLEFQRVHDTFRPRVLRYLTRLVGEREAEDLTQRVMLKVSNGLPGFRGDSSLSTWIYRIATNVALDMLRNSVSEQALDRGIDLDDGDTPLGAQVPSAEVTAIREEMNACVREFIDRLPGSYRTVIVLSELEGFNNGDIALMLGVSLDTVKIRLHRAREKLRIDLKGGCTFQRDEDAEFTCDRKRG